MMNAKNPPSDQQMRQKRKQFHAILAALGIMKNKSDLIANYGADSTLELTENELDELIYRLKQMQTARTEPTQLMRKWRSINLSLLTEIGIYSKPDDWGRVNAFMLDSRIKTVIQKTSLNINKARR
jgi:hypothetical protein